MNMPQKAIRGKKEQCRDRNEEKTRLRERKGKRWFSGSKTESGRSTAFYGLCATVSLVTVPSRYRRPYSDQLIYLITFWRWGLYPCVSWMFLLHTLLLKAKLRHWSEARVRKIYSSFSLSPLATWQIFCAPGPNWYIHSATAITAVPNRSPEMACRRRVLQWVHVKWTFKSCNCCCKILSPKMTYMA